MHEALTKLGHKTYHFKEIGQTDIPNEPAHIDAWREAFLAKMYGNGKPYGKEEFDRLLRRYSVCAEDDICHGYQAEVYYPGCNGCSLCLLLR